MSIYATYPSVVPYLEEWRQVFCLCETVQITWTPDAFPKPGRYSEPTVASNERDTHNGERGEEEGRGVWVLACGVRTGTHPGIT